MDGFIGEGTLYWDELTADGLPTGLSLTGNTKKFALKPDSDKKELTGTGRDNYGQPINTVYVPKASSISLILNSFDIDVLKKMFLGTRSDTTVAAGTASNESLTTLAIGKYVDIGRRNISNFVATTQGTTNPSTATDVQTSTAYSVGDIVSDVADEGGHCYRCKTAGTTGASLSSGGTIFSTTGGTNTTGTAAITDMGDLSASSTFTLPSSIPVLEGNSAVYKLGEMVYRATTGVMRITTAGASTPDADPESTSRTWPSSIGETISIDGIVLTLISTTLGSSVTVTNPASIAETWTANTAYRYGCWLKDASTSNGRAYMISTAGTTGATSTNTVVRVFTTTGADVTSGTAIFEDMGALGASTVTTLVTTDYELNARLGWFKALTSTAASKTLSVSYSYGATTSSKILCGTNTTLRARLVLDGRNKTTQKDCVVRVWNAVLTPTKEFDFLASDFETFELQGSMLITSDKSSAYEVEYFD